MTLRALPAAAFVIIAVEVLPRGFGEKSLLRGTSRGPSDSGLTFLESSSNSSLEMCECQSRATSRFKDICSRTVPYSGSPSKNVGCGHGACRSCSSCVWTTSPWSIAMIVCGPCVGLPNLGTHKSSGYWPQPLWRNWGLIEVPYSGSPGKVTVSPGGHAHFGLFSRPLALVLCQWRSFHLVPHPFSDGKPQAGRAAALLTALGSGVKKTWAFARNRRFEAVPVVVATRD